MKKQLFAILLIPVIFFIYGIYTLNDYGINWDEPYHFRRGQAFLQYYLTGEKTYSNIPRYQALKGTADSTNFRDSEKHFQEVIDNPNLSDPNFRRSYYQDEDWNGEYHIDTEDPSGHPALNGILAALFNKIFYQKLGIMGDLESYHFFEITIASLLVFFIAIFMWKEYGVIESIVSSLALTTYPLFIAEQHFNIKDPIIATFYTVTLISAFKAISQKSSLWLTMSILSFAIGLSIKFNIVFIIIPICVWAILYFWKNRKKIKFANRFYLIASLSPIFILFFFLFFFPSLWKNPVEETIRIIKYYLDIGYSSNASFLYSSPLKWIIYTTPLITLFLSLLIFVYPKKILEHSMFVLLLALTLFITILRVTLPKTVSYGGVRQIMEYIPILAMLCGIGAGFLFKRIKKIPKLIFITLIIILYIPITIKLISIHPNENVYFNVLIGGLSGAKEKGINSWGNSYGNAYYPAILWLNEHAEENAKLTIPVGSISNIPRYKLRPDISLSTNYWSGPKNNNEYVLELTYDYAPMQWYSLKYLNTALKPVYEVKVDGVPIARLWKNSPEFILPYYKNFSEISKGISLIQKSDTLEISLPNQTKIMQLTLNQPITNCLTLKTGYIETSLDNKNWIREPEDIAREQLRHAKLKELKSSFTFYFVATESKYIKIHTGDRNSCLLKSFNPRIIVLN